MERATIQAKLIDLITEYIQPELKPLLLTANEDTQFVTDLQLDSVDLVDIVIQAETQFGIAIENETIPTLLTIGKCIDVVEKKIAEKQI